MYISLFTGIIPMDSLEVKELREEFCLREMKTEGKRKPQLEADFDELRRGITNVPVLKASLTSHSLS